MINVITSFHFYFMCSNLLEKTSDAVIKAAKNGDLALVSFYLLNSLLVFNNFFYFLSYSWRNFICKDIHFYRLTRWVSQRFTMPVDMATKMLLDFWSLMLPMQSSIWLTTIKVKRRSISRRQWKEEAFATCWSLPALIYSSEITRGKHRKY